MDNQIKVPITITFGEKEGVSIETQDVPLSLILEALNNFTRFLAVKLVQEATEVVDTPEDYEKYLDSYLMMLLKQKLKDNKNRNYGVNQVNKCMMNTVIKK